MITPLLFGVLHATLGGQHADRATAILKAHPVFDGHNDLPWMIRMTGLNRVALEKLSPRFQTDLVRLQKGHVGAQFWSVWVPPRLTPRTAVKTVKEQISLVKRMIDRYPNNLVLALNSASVEKAFKEGRIASLIGMEGGHSINSSLGELRTLYKLGARYMTLTHSKNTPWADSATDKPAHGGLTKFGENVVREMNRLGMIVDLSHVSPNTMADALRVAKAPVIFSHSGARKICNHVRNVPDDVLLQVKRNNGVVMVIFIKEYVSEEHRKWYAAREALTENLKGTAAQNEQKINHWDFRNPEPIVTAEMVADHIDHIKKLIGVDHIGIGSDFDGGGGFEGLHDVSRFPNLIEVLLKRGYSESEIAKIANQNVLRVMKECELVAQGIQAKLAVTR